MNKYTKLLNDFAYVSTGEKACYYTLWMDGEFIQNLSTDKNKARQKCLDRGLQIPEDQFEIGLNQINRRKPIRLFGASFTHKNDYWFAEATSEFFEEWKQNKEEMKEAGWWCSKYTKDSKTIWYMFFRYKVSDTNQEN